MFLRLLRTRRPLALRARTLWSRSNPTAEYQPKHTPQTANSEALTLSGVSKAGDDFLERQARSSVDVLQQHGWSMRHLEGEGRVFTVSYQLQTAEAAQAFFRAVEELAEKEQAKPTTHISFTGAILRARVTCFPKSDNTRLSDDVAFPISVDSLRRAYGATPKAVSSHFRIPARQDLRALGPYVRPTPNEVAVPHSRTLALTPRDFVDYLEPMYLLGWTVYRTAARDAPPRLRKLFVFHSQPDVNEFYHEACKLAASSKAFGLISMSFKTLGVLVQPWCHSESLNILTIILALQLERKANDVGESSYRVPDVGRLMSKYHPMSMSAIALVDQEKAVVPTIPKQACSWYMRMHGRDALDQAKFAPIIIKNHATARLPSPLNAASIDNRLHSINVSYRVSGHQQLKGFLEDLVALARGQGVDKWTRIICSGNEISLCVVHRAQTRTLPQNVHFAALVEELRNTHSLRLGSKILPTQNKLSFQPRSHTRLPKETEPPVPVVPVGAGPILEEHFQTCLMPLYQLGWAVDEGPVLKRVFALSSMELSLKFFQMVVKSLKSATVKMELAVFYVVVTLGSKDKNTLELENVKAALRLETEFVSQDPSAYFVVKDVKLNSTRHPMSIGELSALCVIPAPPSPQKNWWDNPTTGVTEEMTHRLLVNQGWRAHNSGEGHSYSYRFEPASSRKWAGLINDISVGPNNTISSFVSYRSDLRSDITHLTVFLEPRLTEAPKHAARIHVHLQRLNFVPRAADHAFRRIEDRLRALCPPQKVPLSTWVDPASPKSAPPILYSGAPIPLVEGDSSWAINDEDVENFLVPLYRRGWGLRWKPFPGKKHGIVNLCKEFPFMRLEDAATFFNQACETGRRKTLNQIQLIAQEPFSVRVHIGGLSLSVSKTAMQHATVLESRFRPELADLSRIEDDSWLDLHRPTTAGEIRRLEYVQNPKPVELDVPPTLDLPMETR